MKKKLKIIFYCILIIIGVYIIENTYQFEYGLAFLMIGSILLGRDINNAREKKL